MIEIAAGGLMCPEDQRAELCTVQVQAAARRFGSLTTRDLRPVYCPSCGRHYTAFVPPGPHRLPTVVHYICAACGGDGRPVPREATR